MSCPMTWNVQKAKRLLEVDIHHDGVNKTTTLGVAEFSDLHEIETNINVMVHSNETIDTQKNLLEAYMNEVLTYSTY